MCIRDSLYLLLQVLHLFYLAPLEQLYFFGLHPTFYSKKFQNENNTLLISDFNSIINENISTEISGISEICVGDSIFIKVDEALAKTNTHTNDFKTQEQIEDIVGSMFDGGTETRISATYDDTSGKINLVVDDMSGDNNTTYSISCVDGDNSDEEKIRITASTGGTDDIVLEAGTGLTIARSGDKITFTNTVTDTTYTVGDGGLTQNNFTNADHTKLN